MITYTVPKQRELHHKEQTIQIPQLYRTTDILEKQNANKQRKVGDEANNLNFRLSFLNNATNLILSPSHDCKDCADKLKRCPSQSFYNVASVCL